MNAWLGTPKTLNYRDIIGSSHVIYQEGSGWVHTLRHPPRLYLADNGSTSLLVRSPFTTKLVQPLGAMIYVAAACGSARRV